MKKFEPPARRKPVDVESFERILGSYGDLKSSPTIIFIGGLHGNEPAGASALQNIFRHLEEEQPAFKGSAHALAGNLEALKKKQRYVDIDLNRTWTPDRDVKLRHITPPEVRGTVEEREKKDLFEALLNIIHHTNGPYYILDLHTVSSDSVPFINIGDTLRNRAFAEQFPLPVVLGIEEQLHGTFLNFTNEHGFVCFGFEAGQHDDPDAVTNNEALIWHAFTVCGSMQDSAIPKIQMYRDRLRNASFGHESIFELRYRYEIDPQEHFRMKPGFRNFDQVKKGQVVAENKNGPIRSPESGRIFMPLYQKQGDDGFFLVRAFHPFWLKISEWMRNLKLERLLPYFPGIRQHPKDRDTLIVNLRIARWYVMEFLHLMGYRRERREEDQLIVTKRKYDLKAPKSYFPKYR